MANGINDSGLVVGNSSTANANSHAFLYDGSTMIDLNDLISPTSGWVLLNATAINNSGQIVGSGTIDGQTNAYLLTPVPEPTSVFALLGGIAGMGGMVLKRKSA